MRVLQQRNDDAEKSKKVRREVYECRGCTAIALIWPNYLGGGLVAIQRDGKLPLRLARHCPITRAANGQDNRRDLRAREMGLSKTSRRFSGQQDLILAE